MFQQLEALVRASGKLQLTLKMDGDRMAVVVVPQGEGKEAALRQPLVLTGVAADLDEGFAQAIHSYATVHASLADQVAATTAILQEAEKSQAAKAQKSLAKGSRAAPAKAGQSDAGSDDGGENGENDDEQSTTAPDTPAPVESAAPANPANDLLSLLD